MVPWLPGLSSVPLPGREPGRSMGLSWEGGWEVLGGAAASWARGMRTWLEGFLIGGVLFHALCLWVC